MSIARLGELLSQYRAWVERDMDGAFHARREVEAKQGKLLACGEGCDHCCHYFITIGPADALRIALRLRHDGLDTLETRAALMRWHEHFEQVEFSAERYNRKWLTCLFLKDGQCSIYEDRPVVCRLCNALGTNAGCLRSDVPIPHEVINVKDLKARNHEGSKMFAAAAWTPVEGSMPEMVVWALDELAFMDARERACEET
jgi:Fe-S-cluster containining protein